MKENNGMLYLVPTPIGNLEDITLRALRILRESDRIYCEDTRHTRKLLNHYQISKPLVSYHGHNEQQRSDEIIANLRSGQLIALVSDAGMPGISDPGAVILRRLIEEHLPFTVLPGPSATITALVYSGLENSSFLFLGFLPRDNKTRRQLLEELERIKHTVILYESPHRIKRTLQEMAQYFPRRPMVLVRELTKIYEEAIRGTVQEVSDELPPNIKGEMVLLLAAEERPEEMDTVDLVQELALLRQAGFSNREAVQYVAKKFHVPKNKVYQASLADGHLNRDRS